MTTTTPIPTSIAAACAAHDRHRLDVLDALLDEAAPTAVRELLGAALDLCASLRAERDELRAVSNALSDESFKRDAQLAAARQVIDEERATVARLTARVAELEARPVMTEESLSKALGWHIPKSVSDETASDVLRHLGPVTLPAQDRAKELIRSILSERKSMMSGLGASLDDKLSDTWASEWINATRAALASLGAPATTPTAAPGLVAAVSVEELISAYNHGCGNDPADRPRINGIRAVLARLNATTIAPVDPREFALVLIMRDLTDDNGDESTTAVAAAARYALTAAGIPVTPEVDK